MDLHGQGCSWGALPPPLGGSAPKAEAQTLTHPLVASQVSRSTRQGNAQTLISLHSKRLISNKPGIASQRVSHLVYTGSPPPRLRRWTPGAPGLPAGTDHPPGRESGHASSSEPECAQCLDRTPLMVAATA